MLNKTELKISRFIEENGLMNPPDGLHLVALSGGADSVCLMLILLRLGYKIEAVHCNFHLRGEESDRDESFVKSLCEKNQVKLYVIHFDTKVYAEVHQVGIEMAARELRYRYFDELRKDIGASDVCVAHHQDDSAETVVMNLMRGTGLRGLIGIRPRRKHIVRPLLCINRQEIESWLKQNHQEWVTDSTNQESETERNLLRLEIFPRFSQKWPHPAENILKTSRRVAEALKVYDNAMFSALQRLVLDDSIEIKALMAEPSPESILYEWLSSYGFPPELIESLSENLPDIPSGRMWKSATHVLYIHEGRIKLAVSESCRPTLLIPETGHYIYDESTTFCVNLSDDLNYSLSHTEAWTDASKISFPLTVRPVRTGDRFQPLGMNGTKLVSDYLTDRHISVHDKNRQLIVSDSSGQIVWLVGHRISHEVRITDATRQTLRITIKDNNVTTHH